MNKGVGSILFPIGRDLLEGLMLSCSLILPSQLVYLSYFYGMLWLYIVSSVFHIRHSCAFSIFLPYQMLYSILDNGNFHVIPGSPADVYAAENYMNVHSKSQLREKNGFNGDDILVLVVGSLFFPNELSWDYAVAMHSIGPLLSIYARRREVEGSFKFVFLCCNSTDGSHDALKVYTFLRTLNLQFYLFICCYYCIFTIGYWNSTPCIMLMTHLLLAS